MKLQYKKYMIFLLGIAILTLGVSMTVKSDIGAGSYDSINFAIADILNTKVSLAISMTAFLVLIITAYIRKGFIRITTFITSVIMGLFTDVWVKVVDLIPVDTILNKLILFIVGMIIFPNFFGVNGVWMVVPFAEIVTLLISLIYIYKYRKEYMYDNMFAKKELKAA